MSSLESLGRDVQIRYGSACCPHEDGRGNNDPGTVMLKLRLIAIALLAACAVAPISADAEPLEWEECKALQAKKRTLLTPKVRSALSRGPDWVKDHLHDYQEIEKVREYLKVEENVAFRCRTDGIRVPKPMPPPLPDRKPPVPTLVVQGTPKILAGVAATSFLPLRKPTATATTEAQAPADEGNEGAGDIATEGDEEPEPGPSQTVADSDKTAPSENKATQ
jgi:hypothetical protein